MSRPSTAPGEAAGRQDQEAGPEVKEDMGLTKALG